MMEFEGKDKVVQRVQANGTMMQMIQMQAMQIQQLQAALGIQQAAPQGEAPQPGAQTGQEPQEQPKTDSLGNEQQTGKRITRPKERAAAVASV